ncbi:MAG TPA: hypothetical protein VFT74_08265 [Isosphaeraceae bacterium]|nr:hypothetical protein [Isosphaeraceae bacterium]
MLVLVNWGFLLLLKAMPHTPGHDGVRQFLPAFGMLALMAGLGARTLIDRFGRWGKRLVIAAVGEGIVSLALMMPVPLSYFSPLIGGLPGAERIGLEPTYYWDSLDETTCEWLDRQTSEGGAIRFSTFPLSFLYAHETGSLRPEPIRYESARSAEWYVVQNRVGMLRPVDRALIERGRPVFVRSKLGVPLLWVFPHDEFLRSYQSVKDDRQDSGAATPRNRNGGARPTRLPRSHVPDGDEGEWRGAREEAGMGTFKRGWGRIRSWQPDFGACNPAFVDAISATHRTPGRNSECE